MITKVARDIDGKIMWVKGRTDISPLTYREFNEGRDMMSGWIRKDGVKYIPPYTVAEEDIKKINKDKFIIECPKCGFKFNVSDERYYGDIYIECPGCTYEEFLG